MQSYHKEIVLFSDFLNLNERNIYESNKHTFSTRSESFGGYELAERQMVAFIPDALMFSWDYPIRCILASPQYPKYAETLTHRDLLGTLINLGIDRGKLGDIVCRDGSYYILCEENIHTFIMDHLTKVKHTVMTLTVMTETTDVSFCPEFEEVDELIASNRIDCIIAKAYHFSRSEAAEYLSGERVFVNGRCMTNCNHSCESGDIVSVRGKGRFIFETSQTLSKKGKLKVRFRFYK